MVAVLHLLSYVAASGAFLFVLLSLASGLLYVAEVIEEHSGLAKTIGQRAIYVIILLFVALHIFDSLPLHLTALGIVCHLVYLQNFSRTWPSISLTSIPFIASCALVVASHFVSFSYFSERARDAPSRHFGGANKYGSGRAGAGGWGNTNHRGSGFGDETFAEVATYFGVCVWLVPMFLFLSLSANDNVLPSAGDSGPQTPLSSSTPTSHRHARKQSMLKSALGSTFSLFLRKSRGSSTQREGLIASPQRSRPTSPSRYSGGGGASSSSGPLYSPSLDSTTVQWGGGSLPPPRSPALSGFAGSPPGGGYGSPSLGGAGFSVAQAIARRPSMPLAPIRRNTESNVHSGGLLDRRPSYTALGANGANSQSPPPPPPGTRGGPSRRPSMEPLPGSAAGRENEFRRDATPPLPNVSPLLPVGEGGSGLVKRRG